jgi:hypothetical protein
MTHFPKAATIFTALALAAAGLSARAQTSPAALALDSETTVAGVGVACTGIGQTRLDPKWQAWPIRVEVSNQKRELLTDVVVAIEDAKGRALATVSCEGPWLLLRPSAEARTVSGWLPGQPGVRKSAAIGPVGKSQRTVELQFTAE